MIDDEEVVIMLWAAPVSEMSPKGCNIRFCVSDEVVGYESCRCNEWCDPPVVLGKSSDDWLGRSRGCECCLIRNGVWVKAVGVVVLGFDSGTVSKCEEELDEGAD